MPEEKKSEREESWQRRNGSLSFAEKLSLFAAAAIAASYSRHLFIALQTGYPISLISAGPWDFVEGLLQSLPFILLVPILLPDLIESYRDLNSRCTNKLAKSNAASLALLLFAALFIVSAFIVYLLLMQLGQANGFIGQVVPLIGFALMVAPLFWPLVACMRIIWKWVGWLYSGDSWIRPFLRLALFEVATVEWLWAVPIAIVILRSLSLNGIHASLVVALAVLLFMAGYFLLKVIIDDNQTIGYTKLISDAQTRLCELPILGRVAVVLVAAVLVGSASFFSWSLNPKVAIDSKGTVYKLLDVFGGGGAVLSVADTEQNDQIKTEPEQTEGDETNAGPSDASVDVEGADGNVGAKGEEGAKAESDGAPGGYCLVDLKNGYTIEEESATGEEAPADGEKGAAENVETEQAGAPNEG